MSEPADEMKDSSGCTRQNGISEQMIRDQSRPFAPSVPDRRIKPLRLQIDGSACCRKLKLDLRILKMKPLQAGQHPADREYRGRGRRDDVTALRMRDPCGRDPQGIECGSHVRQEIAALGGQNQSTR